MMMTNKPSFFELEKRARAILTDNGLVIDGPLDWSGNLAYAGTEKDPYGKAGRYILHPDFPPSVTLFNYHDGGEKRTFSLLDENAVTMTQAEKDALFKTIREQQAQREAERAKRRAAAAAEAKKELTKSSPAGNDNAYLARKGVPAIKGLKQDAGGNLLIPVLGEAGRLQSLQTITADGSKRFLTDGAKAGGYFPIPAKDGSKAGPLLIGEGYATCMSAHLATGYAALCAFDAGNLKYVADYARAQYPKREILLLADNDCTDKKTGDPLPPEQNTGVVCTTAAAAAIGAAIAVSPPLDGRRSDFNDIHKAQGLQAVKDCIEAARAANPPLPAKERQEAPLPLRRPPKEQAPYPVECFLGFSQVVDDISRYTNTPPSMAGGTLLASLSWLGMRYVNVKTVKYRTPLAVYLLLIGETGDGKTTVEGILTKRIKEMERQLLRQYSEDMAAFAIQWKAYERELKKLDLKKNLSRDAYATELADLERTKPIAPVKPVFLIGDLNIEGLFRNLREGLPYIGVFSDDAGRLFGGTAFAKENELKTISNLAAAWSGSALDKMRAGEGASKLYDRRICASLMIQPEVAEMLFNNKMMSGQGYLCRQLVSWPVPMMKSPEQTEIESLPSVQMFYRQCDELLNLPVRTDDDGGIIFDDLELSQDALEAYKSFFTYIEERRMDGGEYEPVNGYAKRAAEQALRIAGCLSMGLNPASRVIPLDVMEAGIKLAEWYLDEVLRITQDDMASPEILQAEKLLAWLHGRHIEKTAVKQVLQYGPNSLREKKAVMPVIDLLAEHEWLVPIQGGALIQMGGKEEYARNAWKVVYAVSDEN